MTPDYISTSPLPPEDQHCAYTLFQAGFAHLQHAITGSLDELPDAIQELQQCLELATPESHYVLWRNARAALDDAHAFQQRIALPDWYR